MVAASGMVSPTRSMLGRGEIWALRGATADTTRNSVVKAESARAVNLTALWRWVVSLMGVRPVNVKDVGLAVSVAVSLDVMTTERGGTVGDPLVVSTNN